MCISWADKICFLPHKNFWFSPLFHVSPRCLTLVLRSEFYISLFYFEASNLFLFILPGKPGTNVPMRYQVFSILANTVKYHKLHGEETGEIVHFLIFFFPFCLSCTLLCSVKTKYYCLVGFFAPLKFTLQSDFEWQNNVLMETLESLPKAQYWHQIFHYSYGEKLCGFMKKKNRWKKKECNANISSPRLLKHQISVPSDITGVRKTLHN